MVYFENLTSQFASLMWGYPLLILMMGGGIFFTLYSRFTPFRFFKHGIKILLGQYDNPQDPGDLTHFQALSTALASTVGMGNISGVAVAKAWVDLGHYFGCGSVHLWACLQNFLPVR